MTPESWRHKGIMCKQIILYNTNVTVCRFFLVKNTTVAKSATYENLGDISNLSHVISHMITVAISREKLEWRISIWRRAERESIFLLIPFLRHRSHFLPRDRLTVKQVVHNESLCMFNTLLVTEIFLELLYCGILPKSFLKSKNTCYCLVTRTYAPK